MEKCRQQVHASSLRLLHRPKSMARINHLSESISVATGDTASAPRAGSTFSTRTETPGEAKTITVGATLLSAVRFELTSYIRRSILCQTSRQKNKKMIVPKNHKNRNPIHFVSYFAGISNYCAD